jgi:hypothetical protein
MVQAGPGSDHDANNMSATIGWAAYLAASWTWCIGMYLPALLVRDLGLAGYLVFALPNVLGAAAMGWTLRTPEASRRLTTLHLPACRWFSIVTLAFHMYWVTWLVGWAMLHLPVSPWAAAGIIPLGLLALAFWRAARHAPIIRTAGLAVTAVSLGVLAIWLLAPYRVRPDSGEFLGVGSRGDALWLLSASTLGFALCPYLDLTFHRARRSCPTPGASRAAFTIGFGVLFALMIVLTLVYAGPIIALADGDPATAAAIPALLAAAVGIHAGLQTAFTVGVHTAEVSDPRTRRELAPKAFVALAAGAALAAAWFAEPQHRVAGLALGEIGYRTLLAFYGLVFPAYVWINVVPLGRGPMRAPTRRSLAVTAAAVVLAAPFFFAGFILRNEPWVIGGVLIVLLAKIPAGPAPRARPEPSP